MINQKPTVYQKLEELEKEKKADQVCEEGSQNWANDKIVTYMELQNEPSDYGDDEEYSSALAIKADAYTKSSSETSKLAIEVVKKMKDLGYERTLYLDVIDLESKYKHKTMRFEKEQYLEEE